VSTPVPTAVWTEVAAADPTAMPFQTPLWRDCVVAGSVGGRGGRWGDASRLYETADGRQLVLMMARRSVGPGLFIEASWPAGWGAGGVLAPGGVRPDEAAMIYADLAGGRAASAVVRPSFTAASAWPAAGSGAFLIPREVHVAHLSGQPFEEYWAHAVSSKMRRGIGNARRHLEREGVVITSGNTPDLVDALYQVYLRWIDQRAGQRRMPRTVARWQARRAEPLAKFATVARALGEDCRIWVAWWQDRPIGATVSLYHGEAAIGWRAFTDRSVPNKFRLFEVMAADALRHACESGCRYLEMGESVGRDDLAAIKRRFGGQQHTFAEYCFERVPLSASRMAFERFRRHAEERIVPARRRNSATNPAA
jgi:Acetyltransferase (GNAT) domain